MPQITGNWGVVAEGNRLVNEQLNYNIGELNNKVAANMAQFDNPQREVYDAVMESVNTQKKTISCSIGIYYDCKQESGTVFEACRIRFTVSCFFTWTIVCRTLKMHIRIQTKNVIKRGQ